MRQSVLDMTQLEQTLIEDLVINCLLISLFEIHLGLSPFIFEKLARVSNYVKPIINNPLLLIMPLCLDCIPISYSISGSLASPQSWCYLQSSNHISYH